MPVIAPACGDPCAVAARLAAAFGLGALPRKRGAAPRPRAPRRRSRPARRRRRARACWPSTGMRLTIFFSGGHEAARPSRAKTAGVSPSSASPITMRLAACSGISSAKRLTLPQSIASSRSKAVVERGCTGGGDAQQRGRLAAADLRPLVRTIRPYRPALAAASSSIVPGHHAAAAAAGRRWRPRPVIALRFGRVGTGSTRAPSLAPPVAREAGWGAECV